MSQVKEAIDQFNQAFKEAGEKQEQPLNIPTLVVTDDESPRGEFASEAMKGVDTSAVLGDASQDSSAETVKQKRNRISAKDRINQQTRKYNEAVAAYNYAMSELEKTKRERDHLAYQARMQYDIALKNHEHALKTDKEYSKKLIKEAMESDDPEKLARANEMLAERSAQLANLKMNKSSQSDVEEDSYEDPQYNAQTHYYQPEPETEEAEVAPEIEEFLDQNPWFDKSSPQFKPELAQEFIKLGSELEDKYLLEGKHDFLQSGAFLKHALSEFKSRKMHPNKPIFQNNQQQRNISMVSPVNRSTVDPYTRTSNNNPSQMELSAEELRTALAIPDKFVPGIEKCRTPEEAKNLKAYNYWKLKNQG